MCSPFFFGGLGPWWGSEAMTNWGGVAAGTRQRKAFRMLVWGTVRGGCFCV